MHSIIYVLLNFRYLLKTLIYSSKKYYPCLQWTSRHWRHVDSKDMLSHSDIADIFEYLMITLRIRKNIISWLQLRSAQNWSKKNIQKIKKNLCLRVNIYCFYQNKCLCFVGIWYLSAQKLRSEEQDTTDDCNCRHNDWVQASSGFIFL